jgi:hypothetical protein
LRVIYWVCEETFDESAFATKVDKMIRSMYPIKENPWYGSWAHPLSTSVVTTAVARGVKRPKHDIDQTVSSAEVSKSGAIPLLPLFAFMACMGQLYNNLRN